MSAVLFIPLFACIAWATAGWFWMLLALEKAAMSGVPQAREMKDLFNSSQAELREIVRGKSRLLRFGPTERPAKMYRYGTLCGYVFLVPCVIVTLAR